MSVAVIRLLRDIRPVQIVIAVAILVALCGIDLGWFSDRSALAGAPLWFAGAAWVFMPSVGFGAKARAWRTLPVSGLDRRRAERWVWLGLPLTWIVLAMALAVGLRTLVAGVAPSGLDVAEGVSIQVLAATGMAAFFSGAARLSRRRSLRGMALLVGAVTAAVLLGGAYRGRLDPAALLAGGGLALVLAIAAITAPDASGEALPGTPPPDQARFADLLPGRSGRLAVSGPRGWSALATYAWVTAAVSVAAAGAAVWSAPGARHGSDAPLPTTALIVIFVIWAVGWSGPARAVRALRALPLGAWALAAVLQGFLLAMAACAFTAIWAVAALKGGYDLGKLHLVFLACIPILALRLPLQFRFGPGWGMALMIAPPVLVPLARLVPESDVAPTLAASLGLTALIWLWTWWELAACRGAYRTQPTQPARWRAA